MGGKIIIVNLYKVFFFKKKKTIKLKFKKNKIVHNLKSLMAKIIFEIWKISRLNKSSNWGEPHKTHLPYDVLLDKLTIQDIGVGSVQTASHFANDLIFLHVTMVDFNDLTLGIFVVMMPSM